MKTVKPDLYIGEMSFIQSVTVRDDEVVNWVRDSSHNVIGYNVVKEDKNIDKVYNHLITDEAKLIPLGIPIKMNKDGLCQCEMYNLGYCPLGKSRKDIGCCKDELEDLGCVEL